MFTSLNLRQNERRPVALLFIYSLSTGAASIFSYTAAFALFLSVFEETSFAYVFLIAAVLSFGIGTWFARLEQRVSTRNLFQLTISVLLVSSFILQIGLWAGAGNWIYFVLLVWYRLYYMLINLAFWGVAGRVLNVQQGKRLFGFVATGEDIARIIGYGTVPIVVTLVGLNNLMLLNSIVVLLMLISVIMLSPFITEASNEEKNENVEQYSLSNLFELFMELFSDRYIRSIFTFTFLGVLSYFLIDYGFYKVIQDQFNSSTALAQFIGYFWMSVYIFSLLVRLFVTNPLLRKWGLFAGLIFLPVVYGVFSLFFGFSTIFLSGTIVVLLVMGAIKFLEDSLTTTITRSASTLLYQPLPAKTTISAQVVAEALIAPIGLGIAGLIILIFNSLPFFNLMWLSFFLIGLAVFRFTSASTVFSGYVEALNKALSMRRLQGSLSDLNDSTSLEVLESYLESDDPTTLVYVIDLLERVAPDRAKHHLKDLLRSKNDYVARAAVRSVGRLDYRSALDEVENLAARQSPVSPEALYTMMALEKDNASDLAISFLDSDNLDLVSQAITGLIQFGAYAKKGVASQKLEEWATSEDVEKRVQAAAICGRLQGDEIEQRLEALLFDASPSVQKQAIQSLVDNQNVFSLESDLKRFEDHEDIFAMIVNTMRLSEGRKVIDELLPYLSHDVISTRTEIFRALNTHGYIALNQEGRDKVESEIDREIKLAHWVSASLADLSKESEEGLLQRALNEMLQEIQRRLFLLLSFVYDKNLINRIQDDLEKGEDSRQQALVLEALSNHLSPAHWDKMGPILQESDSRELWRRLRRNSSEPRLSYIKRVEAIIMTPKVADLKTSEWLRVTALFDLGAKKLVDLKDVLAFCAVHDDMLIRETAEWALEHIEE